MQAQETPLIDVTPLPNGRSFDLGMHPSKVVLVIYKHPTDFPGKYVVRRWDAFAFGDIADTENCYIGDTLDEVREHVSLSAKAAGKSQIRYDRADSDDPVIVESWLIQ